MKYKHLSYSDRQEMEKLYLQGWHMNDIAAKLGVSLATVYHERARGDTGKMDKNGRGGYSAELAQSKIYARRARESRWKAKTCSRVVHPRFGEVIVPHTSNYAAMLNAAEYWGCDWLEIIDDVEVWAVGPDAVPVKMPRHERNGR